MDSLKTLPADVVSVLRYISAIEDSINGKRKTFKIHQSVIDFCIKLLNLLPRERVLITTNNDRGIDLTWSIQTYEYIRCNIREDKMTSEMLAFVIKGKHPIRKFKLDQLTECVQAVHELMDESHRYYTDLAARLDSS